MDHGLNRIMSHHYLEFRNVRYRYPGGQEALCGISLRITHGQKVALAGVNGAGKSTLLLHTDGLLMPSEGEVIVGGVTLRRQTLRLVRQSVGVVFQNPDDQLFMPTVEEDVAFGPANMGLSPDEIEARVARALESVGASALRHRAPHTLSGGQKRSVAIAAVLAMEPSVLVLDEPTAALDPRARRQVIELLRGFDHTMIVATHDMDMIGELCPRTIVMARGRIVADGPTRQVFADRAEVESWGLEPPRNR